MFGNYINGEWIESGAGIADILEDFGFVGGEAFNGLDQIGDQV